MSLDPMSPGGSLSTRAKATPLSREQERLARAARCELRIAGALRHPALQEVFGACVDVRGLFVLSEPFLQPLSSRIGFVTAWADIDAAAARGDRKSSQPPLEECERLYVSTDLAAGLDYLHCRGVAHRRVVLENAFIRDPGDEESSVTAKLGGLFSARTALCAAGLPPADARPIDVQDFGALLLKIWRPPTAAAGEPPGDCDGPSEKREADALVIRDASLRLITGRCLSQDIGRRPSARVLHTALLGVQSSDVEELPEIAEDPSRDSALANIAADDWIS